MVQWLFTFFALTWTCGLTALPAHVIIIRHAETTTDTHELSWKGKERAAAYVPYFLFTPELAKLGTPAAIYASTSSKNGQSSQRAVETVKELADKLQLTVFDKYEPIDYKKLAEEIKTYSAYSGKTILIAWDHATIPELARAFGAFQTPALWHITSFDRTWVISFQSTGKAIFQNLPQRLMFGDSST